MSERGSLGEAVAALKADLRASGGPRISAMRNYQFAILPYPPDHELDLRKHVFRLTQELRDEGWGVLEISLQQLLLDRIRATGEANLAALVTREKRLFAKDPERALAYLRDRIAPHIEGPGGIAADVAARIGELADRASDERTLVLIGRAGALYPFFRSSALLKHIDGRTRNVPVVLLYPGERDGEGLSFMCELPADHDYRPRIYG